MNANEAKQWIFDNWDKLIVEKKLMKTVANYLSKFVSRTPRGKFKPKTEEETVKELAERARKAFGSGELP